MEEKEVLTNQETETVAETNVEAETVSTSEVAKENTKKSSSKKTEVVNYDNLSDDEIYAKIQTEKLLKRKQTRKIATLVGMCVAFVLAVCVIILASVPVSLKPKCASGGFADVGLFPGNLNGVTYSEGQDGYKDFVKKYDEAFSQSYISALFTGSLFSYDIEEKLTSVSSVVGTAGSLHSNNIYYVRLRYSEEQVLTRQNGKAYLSKYISKGTRQLTFTDVYVEVSQESGLQSTNIYVVANGYTNGSGDPTSYIVKITVKANTYAIYNSWSALTD